MNELDVWIYSCLDKAAKNAREALESYRYNDAASAIMEYFWNEFCDWYVEASKLSFKNGDNAEKDRQASVLLNLLEESLRLLHPYLPFVTEEIYSKLPVEEIVAARKQAGDNKIVSNSEYTGMIINAPYPEHSGDRENKEVSARFEVLKDLIGKIRALRVECGLDPASKIHIAILVTPGSPAEVTKEKVDMIELLVGASKTEFVSEKPEKAIGAVGTGFEAFIIVDENIDKESLKTRFQKQIDTESEYVRRSEAKLNGNFALHAKPEIVQQERDRMNESIRAIEKLRSYLKSL